MYTSEEVEYLVEEYRKGVPVSDLAEKLGKSPRSIIGKLSRLGVYEKREYRSKTGERPITKLELCARIAQALGVDPELLEGLDKTPKSTLKLLEERLM